MSYLITYVRRKGAPARTVSNYDMDERTARVFCEGMASLSQRVVLSETDDDGITNPVAIWENGHARRAVPEPVTVPAVRTIDGEVAAEDDDAAEEMTIAEAAAESDAMVTTAYCMKCHENREIHGTHEVTDTGRHRIKGTCPVCGSQVMKFIKASDAPSGEFIPTDVPMPEDEFDGDESTEGTIHILQRDDAGRGKVRLFCSCDEWETTVKAGSAAETRATAAFAEHEAETESPEEEPEESGQASVPAIEFSEAQTAPEVAVAAAEVAAEVTESIAEDEAEAPKVISDEDKAAIREQSAELNALGKKIIENTEARKKAARKAPAKKAQPEAKAEPAKKAAPRKRAAKAAANGSAGSESDKDAEWVASLPVMQCGFCEQQVPVKTSGDGSLRYLMIHSDPAKKLDRCRGSQTPIED